MNYINSSRSEIPLLFLFLFLLLSPLIILTQAEADAELNGKREDEQGPSLVERAIGITGLDSRWDAVRTWAKLAWMNIRPPDAKLRQGSDSANVVKEAAARSFETSKEMVEQVAASAAKVAGEATEKLRRTMSSDQRDQKSEL